MIVNKILESTSDQSISSLAFKAKNINTHYVHIVVIVDVN